MEKAMSRLTSAPTSTIASIAALPWEAKKAEIEERVARLKKERLAIQLGELPDPRQGHHVRFEAGGDTFYRYYPPGHYYCRRCRDYERVYQCAGEEIVSEPCTCIEKRRQEAEKKRLEARLADAGLRKKFRNRTFENFSVTELNRPAWEAARAFAENFANHRHSGKSLFLVGDSGRGKTHLAAAVLSSVVRQGFRGIFVVTIELLSDIRATYQSEIKSEQEVLRPLRQADLLVLDDISAVDQFSEWEKGKLYEIINMRYETEKPILVTSNKMVSWIKDRLGKKVVDRLLEMCGDFVPVDGENYRERIASHLRCQD
ncbi:MAG: ATP-binding protein [bacterium]|jgi:DNA replication protein DnaC